MSITPNNRKLSLLEITSILLVVAVLICIALPFIIGANYCYDANSIEREQAQMRPIMIGLSGYYEVNGHFPDSVSELVPASMPSLPVSIMNQAYVYRNYDEFYELCFFAAVSGCSCGGCCYQSRFDGWECCTHGHSEGRP